MNDKKISRRFHRGFTKGMSSLTSLITFYSWITGLVSEERVDFNKILKTVSSKILMKELMVFSLDGQTASWIENWLNGQAQRVVMSVLKSYWRPVTCSLSHGSILSQILVSIFINNLNNGAACTLSKFANDTKLGELAETSEGHAAIQKVFHRMKKWAVRSL